VKKVFLLCVLILRDICIMSNERVSLDIRAWHLKTINPLRSRREITSYNLLHGAMLWIIISLSLLLSESILRGPFSLLSHNAYSRALYIYTSLLARSDIIQRYILLKTSYETNVSLNLYLCFYFIAYLDSIYKCLLQKI